MGNPQKTKYSPHALYFKRNKKSKQSPYGSSESKKSSNGSSVNQPSSGNDDYGKDHSISIQIRNTEKSLPNQPFKAGPNNINIKKRKLIGSDKKVVGNNKDVGPHNTIVTDSVEPQPKVTKQPPNVKIMESFSAKSKNLEPVKPYSDGITSTAEPAIEVNLNPGGKIKPSQKLHESLVTVSSPSRGSVLTNPQQPGGRFGSSLNNSNLNNSNTQDSYPLKPCRAIQIYKNVLSDYETAEILNFREIYYVGENAASKKIKGSLLKDNNCGYDDERGDYIVVEKDHIGYRFEVIEKLGQGSFGQAFKCHDHKTDEDVAIKVIKNDPSFQFQAGVEVKILTHLRDNDPHDKNNIIKIKEVFDFRSHL